MSKENNPLTAADKLRIIETNSHLNQTQIRLILRVGPKKATEIIDEGRKVVENKGKKLWHPSSLPTDIFLEVSGLNLEFMRNQVRKEVNEECAKNV